MRATVFVCPCSSLWSLGHLDLEAEVLYLDSHRQCPMGCGSEGCQRNLSQEMGTGGAWRSSQSEHYFLKHRCWKVSAVLKTALTVFPTVSGGCSSETKIQCYHFFPEIIFQAVWNFLWVRPSVILAGRFLP
jgi:hypothetical protein